MFKNLIEKLRALPEFSLATSFRRIGLIGFWLQIVVGALPIALMTFTFLFSQGAGGPRAGLPAVSVMTMATLLLLLFTIFWFTRYQALGRAMSDPGNRPSEDKVLNTLWIGLVASSVGALMTIIIIVFEASHVLFYFLTAPQGGAPAVMVNEAASFASALDMMNLLLMAFMLLAELIVIFLSLYLLFRVTEGSPEYGGVAKSAPR